MLTLSIQRSPLDHGMERAYAEYPVTIGTMSRPLCVEVIVPAGRPLQAWVEDRSTYQDPYVQIVMADTRGREVARTRAYIGKPDSPLMTARQHAIEGAAKALVVLGADADVEIEVAGTRFAISVQEIEEPIPEPAA